MEVILVRHGTRNFMLGDVPLNSEGQEQAAALCKNSDFTGVKTLISSPKQRAQMTLQPLSEKLELPIKIVSELDQIKSDETELSFSNRVQGILTQIEQQKWTGPLVLCSHSDWLSMALQIIPSDSSDLKYQVFQCCEYLRFQIDDGLWHLKD